MTSQPSRMFIGPDGRSLQLTFWLVSSLFLLWGFCNGMIDVMDKHFQERLHLNLAQSAWVQFAHYLGYFLMALPAGSLAQRLGYKGGIIAGLLIVSAGGFWFLAATRIESFWAFLLGVCVIASGLTFLETVANPYTVVLGDARHAATRINLAQSCNSVGWILGPIAGSMYFYSADARGNGSATETLHIPYVGVAVGVLLLAVVFLFARVPEIHAVGEAPGSSRMPDNRSLWSRPHFSLAVAAQFLYVAAQAGIFAFFINYMTSQVPSIPTAWDVGLSRAASHAGILQSWLAGWFGRNTGGSLAISDKGAANLASVAFILFLAGRLTGAALLKRMPPHRVLGVYGLMNVVTSAVVFAKVGWLSVACVFLSYFFMSIMFPTIFALGIHALGTETKRASAFLVMAIMGGALLPKLMGHIADITDVSRSFILPMVCFAFIAFYGFRWAHYAARSQRDRNA